MTAKKITLKKQKPTSYKSSGAAKEAKLVLTTNIDENLTRLKEAMNNSFDIQSRKFRIGGKDIFGAVLYIENLVKEDTIFEYVIKPMTSGACGLFEAEASEIRLDTVKESLIGTGEIEEGNTLDQIVLAVMSGNTVILIDGYDRGLLVGTRQFSGRSIEMSDMEPSIKGAKESFIENINVNIGLIRKRLRDPNLTLELHMVGRRSKSNVVLTYIKGIVNQQIVDKVRKRVQGIDVDGAVTSAQVYGFINDRPNSIFPLVQVTERPDKVVAALMEGRVAVLVEGTPSIILVPVTLPMLMQSSDDYHEQWIVSSVFRIGRYIALFISALLPSLYIAMTSFHPGILPTKFTLSITATRKGVPFPAFFEALLMTAILELLIEAGIRLPKVVGQTVSIVGGLVIGQAAVQAGIISPIMVIVISITAISSFAIPDYSLGLATRILRLPFIIAATTFGTVGTSLLLIVLLGYTSSLESFGVGFLEPLSPYRLRDYKDTLIRGPQKFFGKRPEFLSPEDTQRQIIKKRRGSGRE